MPIFVQFHEKICTVIDTQREKKLQKKGRFGEKNIEEDKKRKIERERIRQDDAKGDRDSSNVSEDEKTKK